LNRGSNRKGIFTGDGEGDLTGHRALGTKVFALDTAPADAWILLNGNLNSGSGSGDMTVYIPNSLFGKLL